MNNAEPFSLGHENKKQTECSGVMSVAPGPTAAALNVLRCLGTPSVEIAVGLVSSRDSSEIARLAGLSREVVCEQLDRLIRYGYIEETTRQRFRLSTQTVGQPEIVAPSTRSSWTRRHKRTPEKEDANGSSA